MSLSCPRPIASASSPPTNSAGFAWPPLPWPAIRFYSERPRRSWRWANPPASGNKRSIKSGTGAGNNRIEHTETPVDGSIREQGSVPGRAGIAAGAAFHAARKARRRSENEEFKPTALSDRRGQSQPHVICKQTKHRAQTQVASELGGPAQVCFPGQNQHTI